MRKKINILMIFSLLLSVLLPVTVSAETSNIDTIINSMTTKEKIAEMIMPSFRYSCVEMSNCNVTELNSDIENILKKYNFAGVILFAQNFVDTKQTVKLIDSIQKANNANPRRNSQLLIATDQEGGYITRLKYQTTMPGNMALGATNDKQLAYDAANIIGQELFALGINTDFAPVVDVNNNPANPVIGVRSFSDDPTVVSEFGTYFMKGLQDNNVISTLKHYPGHGDTSTDTHSSMTIVNKSYDEIKKLELIPFQGLINNNVEMIMTAHISYPQIDNATYISTSDGSEITLPATLSKKMITDILRNDMGFNGVVTTDALDMGAIANHFDRLDVAKLAINAGVDILLMPVETNGTAAINDLESYIDDVAALVDSNEISISNINASVKRILKLKESKNLLTEYNVNVDEKIENALKTVSSLNSHNKEFEIAKKAITLIKNDNDILPLSEDDETMILYAYESHLTSSENAFKKLIKDKIISNSDNVKYYDYTDNLDEIKENFKTAKNVIIINALNKLSGASGLNGLVSGLIDEIIESAKENNVNTILVSTQLPYDAARYNNVDAIIATYLTSGITFDLDDYTNNIPKYGANLMAGIYQLFDKNANFTGKLPVNIYELNSDYTFSNKILYKRGYGLNYKKKIDAIEYNDANTPETKDNLYIYVLILLFSFAGIISIIIYNKKLLK